MRKRFTAAALAALCLCLAACAGGRSVADEGGLAVWYRHRTISSSDGSAVGRLYFKAENERDLLHEALTLLTEDPDSDEFVSAFPSGVRISSYNLEGGVLDVHLTAGYAEMGVADRNIARCCLVLTLCALDEVDSVNIYQESVPLEKGLTAGLMLTDNGGSGEYEEKITLYFPDASSRTLYAEERRLTVAAGKPLAEYAVEELFSGAKSCGSAEDDDCRFMPEGARLLSVKTEEGLCTVDFSEEFYLNRPLSAVSERLLLYSIVDTLTLLPDIDRVQITVEGRVLPSYTYIDISKPLERAEEFIKSGGDYWAGGTLNLYLGTPDGRMTAVTVTAGTLNYEQWLSYVVNYYIGLDRFWGYRRLVPEGTRVLSAEVKDGICRLDLSSEFSNNSRAGMYTASRAIAATLYDAGAAQGLVLSVEGKRLYSGIIIYKDENIIVK